MILRPIKLQLENPIKCHLILFFQPRSLYTGNVDTSVRSLFSVLPDEVTDNVDPKEADKLVEIVLDEGRAVEYRFIDGTYVEIVDLIVTNEMLKRIEERVGSFGPDNRAGISRTLHRISRIQNRFGDTVGMTCRVGRPFEGCVELIKDIVDQGKNILLLGKPGVGKTTKLRDIARHLSTELNRRVIVIDTSNEIGGDGTLPHTAIGRSRRMQVPYGKQQHTIMREAVENHMPEVIIVDEISDQNETEAARTIAQRGVQLIATAHGSKLFELMQNPPLCGLLGGIKSVQIGDDLMRQRNLSRKTIQERQFPPIFDVVVELLAFDEVSIHTDMAEAVDAMLAGGEAVGEGRRIHDGHVLVLNTSRVTLPVNDPGNPTIGDHVAAKRSRLSKSKR